MSSSSIQSCSSARLGRILTAWLAAASVVSCSDGTTEPTGAIVSICHGTGATATLRNVHMSELAGYLQQGDYVAKLVVEKATTQLGDSIHFARIGDALAVARAGRIARNETAVASCRMTIEVGSGVFAGSSNPSTDPAFERLPLVIDVPDISLHGAFTMAIDPGGRATGGLLQGTASTTLVASPGLLTTRLGGAQNFLAEPEIIVMDLPTGPGGVGAIIEGFVFQSGNSAANAAPGGNAVFAMRAKGLRVRHNRFEGGFTEPISFTASQAVLEENHVSGKGGSCGICLVGPGTYEVTGNRLTGPGGIPGIFTLPVGVLPLPPMVAPLVPPTAALITATITNNEVTNHLQNQAGAGLRIGALGNSSSDVSSASRIIARNNTLVNNTFGVMVEAAFPVLGTLLKGDVDLTLQDNTITGNCQNGLYVAFARHVTGLGLLSPAQFQSAAFLKNSVFSLKLLGEDPPQWKDAWVANPPGLGNTLTVDGQQIPNGTRVAYDATKVCAPI